MFLNIIYNVVYHDKVFLIDVKLFSIVLFLSCNDRNRKRYAILILARKWINDIIRKSDLGIESASTIWPSNLLRSSGDWVWRYASAEVLRTICSKPSKSIYPTNLVSYRLLGASLSAMSLSVSEDAVTSASSSGRAFRSVVSLLNPLN